jgi:5-methyltetrahydropteroyltriglutamate--homocysteine methyltransferase
MTLATNLGFPRIGLNRELKRAQENFWQKKITASELKEVAENLRLRHWQLQTDAGIDHIPCNDFSFYDQMLDMSALLGAIPARYNWHGDRIDLDTYFSMARGSDTAPAMEMTKWFDTNYHYIVPEFSADQKFALSGSKLFDDIMEAKTQGFNPRPVLIGPVTYLSLGKAKGFDPIDLMPNLLPVYVDILQRMAREGIAWVQIDEPYLTLDLDDKKKSAFKTAYTSIAQAAPSLNILLATYFEGLRDNLDLALSLPTKALHLDVVRAPDQLAPALAKWPADKILSLGLVDGRNIWRNDLRASLTTARAAIAKLGDDNVWIAPSCSLLHSPVDLNGETKLDAELKSWMAFATQKIEEISLITLGINEGDEAIADALKASDAAQAARKSSTRIHNPAVKDRVKSIKPAQLDRASAFNARQTAQREKYNLPLYPTTTIGSFPQTTDIREARAAYKAGKIDQAAYDTKMKAEIAHVVTYQDQIGIDVLVHGEAERNDMVEYFGEQLDGFTFTMNGWVQSYGSRCVKPPIIFGDVSRPKPMTVAWSTYAQSLTKSPMKGMLTGPITILQWSFVRNDQPRSVTCQQIALALRDEVQDLEKAGITIIQIDEPAIREGLPLRRADGPAYLRWAVDCFRLSAAGVADTTQIHTHMCYSEFNDIIKSIGEMDADVISIETSRSHMELLDAFVNYNYPNEIGPGVYDIHSPRVPATEEMVALLNKARAVLDADQIWVNPDCGLKTRGWPETEAALSNMVESARAMRDKEKSQRKTA